MQMVKSTQPTKTDHMLLLQSFGLLTVLLDELHCDLRRYDTAVTDS